MKFNFLNDNRLNNRYATVDKNIRSESNSFYDSYLDLVECLIKKIIEDQDFEIKQQTAGEILKVSVIKDFFNEKLHYDSVPTLKQIIANCNKHKHEFEKQVDVDDIVFMMKEFFNLINSYSNYRNIKEITFDAKYYYQIFGQTKRENVSLSRKVQKLIDELKVSYENKSLSEENMIKMKAILSSKQDVLSSIEEENLSLNQQIDELKDIKINSMEVKLNRTIELLLELKESIAVNKTLSKAIGTSIIGDDFEKFVEEQINKDGRK